MTNGPNGRSRADTNSASEIETTSPHHPGAFLFIGGSLDGEHVPVANPDSPVWIPVKGSTEHDEYRPMYFRVTPHREHIIYAIAGMCADHVLQKLIEAYPSMTPCDS